MAEPQPGTAALPVRTERDGPLQPLPPPQREHLATMTGPLGIWQFAAGAVPDPMSGTCTDDVARALEVDLLQAEVLGWDAVAETAVRSLAYLEAAWDPGAGRFRNLRDEAGRWRPDGASQDATGRAILALAMAATCVHDAGLARRATVLLRDAALEARGLTASRAIAAAVLGCARAADVLRGPGMAGAGAEATGGRGRARPVGRALELLAGRLHARFVHAITNPAWPWPEPAVTYESAILPRALLVAGTRLGRRDIAYTGRLVLDWLLQATVDTAGRFHPVGNDGWWPRGGRPPRFDQQPIEAHATVAACADAMAATGEARYADAAEAAFSWFLGANDLGIPLADPDRGSCRDGLGREGANENRGAESTLAWLASVERMRGVRQRMGSTMERGSGRGHDLT